MATLFDTRRYLTDFDSTRTGHLFTDVLVIGTGVAGARAAIEAARHGTVIVLSKSRIEESATLYAQGGIAAALAAEDSPQRHREDTLRVGCGLCREEVVEVLTADAPDRIRELVDWGVQLDHDGDDLALTREGGHSFNRIVHAGDSTGREVVTTLRRRLEATEGIRVFDHCFLIDLITQDGACVGAITFHEKYGHQLIWAKQTVVASGGCGQIWRESTNPAVATGDGLAAAFRAGARLYDLEMMQFHPTTLYIAGAARALISEAVRGEGAFLVDRNGERFMPAFHEDAELAPRDVGSRAMHRQLAQTHANCVYLDVRAVKGFAQRFPNIARLCQEFEIDVTREGIPVRPSAHYQIGGIQVELDGSTNLRGLLACGEVTCSGVHGANRIASNSLLEGLVLGRRAGETAGQRAGDIELAGPVRQVVNSNPPSGRTQLDLGDIHNSLRSLMWRNVGIERGGQPLAEAVDIISFWGHYTMDKVFDAPEGWELQNQLTLARLIAQAALERTESIGVHCRSDAAADSGSSLYHVMIVRSQDGTEPLRVSMSS